MRFRIFAPFSTLALAACVATSACAQEEAARNYPSKPVRVVVGLAAGGGTDLVARMLAPKLQQGLGQPFLVENRSGVAGIVGADSVARAAPDGYTLLFAPNGTAVTNPIMFRKLPYDTLRDFVPISLVGTFPLILAVNSTLPIRSVKELVDYLKANPGKVNASGSGAAFQLATELFKSRTGTRFEYIPYKGSNEGVAALLSGEIQMTLVDAGPILGSLKGGRVLGLAVTTPTRLQAFPDIPTMQESGFPDLEMRFWMALFAPAGTPPGIVKKLEAEVNRIVKMPDFRESMNAKLTQATGSTSEDLARFISSEISRWDSVRKAANIKPND